MGKVNFEEFLRSSGRPEDPVDYHLVRRRDVDRRAAPKHKRVQEFALRVKKANKCFRGRYDDRHANWMRRLVYDIDLGDKIKMSLDSYKALIELK
jgi:hypothetical protein